MKTEISSETLALKTFVEPAFPSTLSTWHAVRRYVSITAVRLARSAERTKALHSSRITPSIVPWWMFGSVPVNHSAVSEVDVAATQKQTKYGVQD